MAKLRLIAPILLLAMLPAAGYAAIANMHHQDHVSAVTPSSNVLTSLSFSISGNATRIGNSTKSSTPDPDQVHVGASSSSVLSSSEPTSVHATASIIATLEKKTNGTWQFNVTGTTLTIGPTSYDVINGTGVFNQHSLVIVVHATVTSGGAVSRLVLIGEATGPLTGSAGGSGSSVGVTFGAPQSKLAGRFFLSLDGTLTVS